MDSTEELSARVLLKHILDVETPRTPLTRSVAAQSSGLRRSGRLNKNDPHTPQAKLRQSLKQKMRESISSQTLPSKRRTASTVLKRTSGPASMILDDDATPRQILKNILLTEPVKSPVVNEHVESQEPQSSPDSIPRGSGTELSGLELSDLTICNVESTVKGLNRKRPPRSLNVTAFEKRLKGENDLAKGQGSIEGDSSLSMSSSLGLKTPFIDVRTERKALQRKGLHRRKVLEEEFGAAVARREMENDHAPGQVHRESTYSEGITLGLSEIGEPDITIDFVTSAHCSKTHGIISNYSRLATQDKSTVMASQIQRDLKEMLDVNEQHYSFAVKENPMTDAQHGNQFLTAHNDNTAKDTAAPCQSEQEESLAKRTFDIGDSEASKNIENVDDYNSEKAISQTDNSGPFSSSESEDKADIQTQNQGEDEDDDEPKKEDPVIEQQSHQEATLTLEKEGTDSQMNDDESMQDGEEEEVQDGEEEEVQDGEEEEVQDGEEEEVQDGEEEEVEDGEEEEVEDGEEVVVEDGEEVVVEDGEYREEELAERGGDETEEEEGLEQTDANVEGKDEVDLAVGDSESNKEVADSQEDEDGNSEHITQRAVSAEDELIVPIPRNYADLPDNSKPGYNVISEPSILKDATEVEADGNENKENSFQESGPPEDVELVEQSVEQSVEDEDDLPSKTPAFVKQKRNFFHSDPQASPFAPKNIQPSDAGPGPKSKQKAQRKLRSPKSDPGLSKSYLMKVIKHFAKTKVSTDVYPVVKDVMDTFLDRLAKDLEAYALHARRSTIGVADCELLLRRQGHVNDKVPVEVLIEKYLRMDQRKLLIPIATSGNVVFPKKL